MALDILVVDDESDIRNLICEVLEDENYETRSANSSDGALKSLAQRVPNILILDIWLQGSELDGLGILEIVRSRYPDLPVIMISGHGSIETAVSAIKIGAYDFIEKPFNDEKLLHIVGRTIELSRLRTENKELRIREKKNCNLIGNSGAMVQIRQTIDRVAPTNSRILISGEEGTGKAAAAKLIHSKSNRSGGNFITLQAAGISPIQMDAELFGIEDASPTGGAKKLGVFEAAHGGTLFIDEVADMNEHCQTKILRVLQQQSFTRVGGNNKVSINVRLIAATSRDLKQEIALGNFREDLYYRLNVIEINMPPLRERREDIVELCEYFLDNIAESLGTVKKRLSDEAFTILQAYNWSGNVRHLQNIMERVTIISPNNGSNIVTVKMLPSEITDGNENNSSINNANIMTMPLREARENFERQYLSAQIIRFGGNISKTSNFIGMERSALHRKLKTLGIQTDEKVFA